MFPVVCPEEWLEYLQASYCHLSVVQYYLRSPTTHDSPHREQEGWSRKARTNTVSVPDPFENSMRSTGVGDLFLFVF